MPRVSAIIPTFNRRAMVLEAARSVLAQSYRDVELVVVDDGSEDGTAEALERELGGALTLLRTPHHGVSAARNRGAAACRGSLLAFLDSDDLWQRRKIERQVAFLDADPQLRICQTEEIWMRGGVRVNPRVRHRKRSGDIFTASLDLCLVSPSAVMMERSLFEEAGGFDESLPACEDYDLWLRLARAHRFGLLAEPLVVRRAGHEDQLSRRHWGMDRFRVTALAKLLASALPPEQRRHTVATLRRKCGILAAGAEKRGRADDAAHYRSLAAAYDA